MPARKLATKNTKASAGKAAVRAGGPKASKEFAQAGAIRNQSSNVTEMMDKQYNDYRAELRRNLAIEILQTIGVRFRGSKVSPDPHVYVSSKDMETHDAKLMGLLGKVKVCYDSDARQALYKNNKNIGKTLAKMVLAKEFPFKMSADGKGVLETGSTFGGLTLWKVHPDAEKYAPKRDRITDMPVQINSN